MRVLIGQGRRKPATDKVTGSVEAPIPSGYYRHHKGAQLRRLPDGGSGQNLP